MPSISSYAAAVNRRYAVDGRASRATRGARFFMDAFVGKCSRPGIRAADRSLTHCIYYCFPDCNGRSTMYRQPGAGTRLPNGAPTPRARRIDRYRYGPGFDAEESQLGKLRPTRRIRHRTGTGCRVICRFFDADQAGDDASRTAARRRRSQRSGRNALNPEKQKNGAGRVTRTPDLRITNALLYQLSYAGTEGAPVYAKHGCSTI
jgi:hypothetical protein